jgi:hypothetical protein
VLYGLKAPIADAYIVSNELDFAQHRTSDTRLVPRVMLDRSLKKTGDAH